MSWITFRSKIFYLMDLCFNQENVKSLNEQRTKNMKVIQEKMKLDPKEVKRFNPVSVCCHSLSILWIINNDVGTLHKLIARKRLWHGSIQPLGLCVTYSSNFRCRHIFIKMFTFIHFIKHFNLWEGNDLFWGMNAGYPCFTLLQRVLSCPCELYLFKDACGYSIGNNNLLIV